MISLSLALIARYEYNMKCLKIAVKPSVTQSFVMNLR